MQQTWLIRQEGNRRLVLYILGWASTPNAVHHITPPPGYDVLAVYNYTDIETLQAADFAGYERIYLFAWSFGVWVAEHIAAGLPLYRAVALNGTPYPVDYKRGMRLRVVLRTMQGLARVGMNPFNEKAYGGVRYIPEGPYPDRSIENKITELTFLAERSKEDSAEILHWDAAYIGTKDEIFPPDKMRTHWHSVGLGTEFESYHYPFADPDIVLRHLGD